MLKSAVKIGLYIGKRFRWITYSYLIVVFIVSFSSPYFLMESLVASSVQTFSPLSPPYHNYAVIQYFSMAGFLFALMVLVSAISMANDLRSSALFHLSQPMSRTDVAISWMILTSWAPSVLCVLSIVIPLMCYLPHLPSGILRNFLLLLSQMLVISSIVLMASATRRSWLVLAVCLLLMFFLPFLLATAISIFAPTRYVSDAASIAMAVLYPLMASTTPYNTTLSPTAGAQAAVVLAAVIQGLYLAYFKFRFEVI